MFLVNFSMPYRRVRAAGHTVRGYYWAHNAFGYLLSFRPDERPPAGVLEVIHDGLEPYDPELLASDPLAADSIGEHNYFVLAWRAVGEPDGLPLRQAIFAGEYGAEAAMPIPPAGIGASRCPLDCIATRQPDQCLCTGNADDLWYRRPRPPPEPQPTRTTAPTPARRGQMRPQRRYPGNPRRRPT